MKKYLLGIILFLIIILNTGCKKSIVGEWKSINTKEEYYYVFNKDNTCSYEMDVARLDCTYEYDDNTIKIIFKGETKVNTYKYKLVGYTLTIIDSNGNINIFTSQSKIKYLKRK